MKTGLIFLTTAMVSLVVGFLLPLESGPEDQIRQKSVKIMCPKSFIIFNFFGPPMKVEGYSQGTGVFVGPGLILTEHHVIEDASRVLVLKHGKTEFIPAVVISSSSEKDLALVSIKDLTNDSVIVNPKVNLGDSLWAIGNAGSKDFQVEETKLTGISIYILSSSTYRTMLQMDNGDKEENEKIRHGFSGGGVFNSKGELVGLTEALGVEEAPLAITGKEIKDYLNKETK